MSPISARSRRPATFAVSMLSSSARASAGSSTGVCPETAVNQPAQPYLPCSCLAVCDLPAVVPAARDRFETYKDLLADYGNGVIAYEEFAARARRRAQGVNEDFDPP
jgi:hypothetical protein